MNEKWFSLDIPEIEKKLNTNAASGLSRKAARSRFRKNGRNNFFYLRTRTAAQCIARVFSDPILILTVAVNVIAAIFGRMSTAIVSGIFILINIVSASLLYIKACRVSESMSEHSQPKVTVIRDGKLFYVDSRAVVRGDILLLEKGDVLPCDVRLISSDDLTVEAYEGARSEDSSRTFSKYACTVHEEPSDPFECPNMILAGSNIVSGSARAIAVEIGEYTFIGALDGGIPLNNSADGLTALRKLRKSAMLYSFIVLAAILPLTVIGIFSFGAEYMLDTFMLIMAISVSALGELIYVIGGIVVSAGLMELAIGEPPTGRAIVKSLGKLDKMASPDYILLLGDAALTDGTFKVSRAICGEYDLLGPDVINANAAHTAELLMMLEYAKNLSPSAGAYGGNALSGSISVYGKKTGVDADAFPIKIKLPVYFAASGTIPYESATMISAGERICIAASDDEKLVDGCVFIRIGSQAVELDSETRKKLKQKVSESRSRGLHIRICASSSSGNSRPPFNGMVLEGVLAFKKCSRRNSARYLSEICKKGTKVLLFTDVNGRAGAIEAAGLMGIKDLHGVITHKDFLRSGHSYLDAADGYKVLIGFPNEAVTELISELQKRGKVVEAVGLSADDIDILSMADVSVTFGNDSYKTDGLDITSLEHRTDSGQKHSPEGAQTLRCTSDAIIKRAGNRGGGVEGLHGMIRISGGIHRNLQNIIAYLVCSQSARVIISALLSMLSGKFLLTPAQLLFGGLALDFFGALVFAFDTYPIQISGRGTVHLFGRRTLSLIAVMSAASLISGGAALILTLLTNTDVSGSLFVSVTLTQLILILFLRYSAGCENLYSKLFVTVSVAALALSAAFSLIPPIATAFGSTVSISLWSLVLVPCFPVLFVAFYFIASSVKIKRKN